MPSHSAKQHNFMEAIAHSKAFAKKVGIPQKVGQDFSNADKGKHFSKGGDMKSEKAHEMHQAKELRRIAAEEEHEAKGMKRGGHTKKMAVGGMGMDPRMAAMMAAKARPRARMAAPAPMAAPMAAPGMKHGGKAAHHEGHEHHMKMAHHHLKMAMKAGGKTMEKGIPHSKDMGEKELKHGGKAKHHYAVGGHVPGQYPLGEKMGKVKADGHKAHGEHAIQERGYTRALQEKMKGNTIGNGPLVMTKKRGGRIC
jgi:hypothetical protein